MKTIFRRYIVVVATVLMLTLTMTVNVFADNTVALKISPESSKVQAGKNVTVQVDVPANSNGCAINVRIHFDKTKLKVISALRGSAIEAGGLLDINAEGDGYVALGYASDAAITKAGSLLIVTFKVDENAKGIIPLTLTCEDFSNYDVERLPTTVKSAGITVVDAKGNMVVDTTSQTASPAAASPSATTATTSGATVTQAPTPAVSSAIISPGTTPAVSGNSSQTTGKNDIIGILSIIGLIVLLGLIVLSIILYKMKKDNPDNIDEIDENGDSDLYNDEEIDETEETGDADNNDSAVDAEKPENSENSENSENPENPDNKD